MTDQIDVDIDIHDNLEFQELYCMISKNYIAGLDGEFALRYSPELLKWALTPPGWRKEWCIGVRDGNQLVGFISGVPREIYENGEKKSIAQVNFLCVYKGYKLARHLIDKLTSRLVSSGKFSNAIYTTSYNRTGSFCRSRYYHRILNVENAIKTTFFEPLDSVNKSIYEKLYQLPDKTNREYRKACLSDIPRILELLNRRYRESKFYPVFTHELLEYMFFSCSQVYCYISHDGEYMFSYYSLPYDVFGDGSSILKTAYMYHTSDTGCIPDILVTAKMTHGMDIFNCMDVSTTSEYLKNLEFINGTGWLFYYKFYKNEGDDTYTSNDLGIYMI